MNDRIRKMRVPMEMQQLNKSQKDHGITCSNRTDTPDNCDHIEALVPGPKGSPYEEGLFKVAITFGEQYPFRPPVLKFLTPVYHPNIDNSGKICLDLLRMPPTGSYNPAITLEAILLSIQLLLANPNPDDPLQGDAADMYKTNRNLFNKKAKEHVSLNCLKKRCTEKDSHSQHEEIIKGDMAKNRLKLQLRR